MAAGSLETLRRANRSRLLEALQQRGTASRADLARATGLSRTTVSSLVADLLADGVVVERTEDPRRAPTPRGGRPPTVLALDPASGGFAGIDLGHDGVRVALVDRAGDLLADDRVLLDADGQPEAALAAVTGLVDALLERTGLPRERLAGAGAAVSAPLPGAGWHGLDLEAELAGRLGVPVAVGNDANLGALAEATFGAGRGVANLLYVMLSAGVGAGLVLGGRVYEGDRGTAGELGHVVVSPEGRVCRCGGRGCLETVAGATALAEALQPAHGRPLTSADVTALAAAADPGARRVVADAGRAVGRALAGLCTVLDPGLVVVGGELAAAGDDLLAGVRESVERGTSPAAGRAYRIVPGALGARAEALGAAALAMAAAPAGP